jgi:MerR family transcriptional regulator/heat shock protein HspR
LTRDLGVNLAGVEIILNMREKMGAMQREFERFVAYVNQQASEFSAPVTTTAEKLGSPRAALTPRRPAPHRQSRT